MGRRRITQWTASTGISVRIQFWAQGSNPAYIYVFPLWTPVWTGPNRSKSLSPSDLQGAMRSPVELLAEYQKAQAAVAEVREKLRKELEGALSR